MGYGRPLPMVGGTCLIISALLPSSLGMHYWRRQPPFVWCGGMEGFTGFLSPATPGGGMEGVEAWRVSQVF